MYFIKNILFNILKMEYEIYLLCNILGIIILFLIIIFHFIDADNKNAKSYLKESGDNKEPKMEKIIRKAQKSKKEKKKSWK